MNGEIKLAIVLISVVVISVFVIYLISLDIADRTVYIEYPRNYESVLDIKSVKIYPYKTILGQWMNIEVEVASNSNDINSNPPYSTIEFYIKHSPEYWQFRDGITGAIIMNLNQGEERVIKQYVRPLSLSGVVMGDILVISLDDDETHEILVKVCEDVRDVRC